MSCRTPIRLYLRMNTLNTTKNALQLCLWVLLAIQLSQGQVPSYADSNPEQLHRMKASYHEWLSRGVNRDLLVEFDPSPVGLDISNPRFSWVVRLEGRGRRQTAFQIQVASTAALLARGRPDVWDSGLVKSSDSTNVYFSGGSLESNQEYFWRVRVRDEAGRLHPYSRTATFRTGLLRDSDWQARWIGRGQADEVVADVYKFIVNQLPPEVKQVEPDLHSPMFRKEFQVRRAIERATLFISGLGIYEAHLNGRKIGDALLSPAKTDYRKRVLYDTYDVTSDLKPGPNALGVLLGNGWFNAPKKWWGWRMQWFGSPRVIAQLEIHYQDGSTSKVVTDDTWKASWSPITFNCLYDGEDYDARLEQPKWDVAGFDDSQWQSANLVTAPGGKLVSAKLQPNVVTQVVRPISLKEIAPAVFIYDMGQNFAGWLRLHVQGPGGTRVKLRFAEAVRPDGSLDRTTMKSGRAEDNYLLRGGAAETYEPRFTFRSFQYVELTGYPGKPSLETLEGVFVHSGVTPSGSFECGNDLINRIHLCTVQSQRINLQMGVPTDCAQRPERLGWGDALFSAEETMFNLDAPRLYAKWITDFQDEQEPSGRVPAITPRPGLEEDLVWSSSYLGIPWYQYLHYGDRRILEDHYESMTRYLEYLANQGRAEIVPRPPGTDPLFEPPEAGRPVKGYLQRSQWGDHASLAEDWKVRSGLPFSISTAFYYYNIKLMEKIATALGKRQDAGRYKELASKIRDAFNKKFFDQATNSYDNGSQAPQAFALSFDLVPEGREQAVMKTLLDDMFEKHRGHLTTGYPGTWSMVEALTAKGRPDLVWHLANLTDFPSWGDIVKGRTAVREKWDGGSLGHVALAPVLDAWFYKELAGIRPDEGSPGYQKIIIKPYVPKDLTWVRARLDSIRGRIESSWRKENGVLRLDLTIPANTTATVYVPASDSARVKEGDGPAAKAKSVKFIALQDGAAVFEIGSGRYSFSSSAPY
jgi:alpha-L-rhamnosidase